MEGNRYSFVCEYFDPQASLVRQYMLQFFEADNSVEMYDMKNRRVFLRKVKYPQLSQKELFIGASVTIFSRVLKLVDFGDEVTRRKFAKDESAFFLLPGPLVQRSGDAIQTLFQMGMRVKGLRMADPSQQMERAFGVRERFVGIHVAGSGIPAKAGDLQARFPGLVVLVNDDEIAQAAAATAAAPTTATFRNCAICVIKPHAIGSGHGGAILKRIFEEGFEVTALGSYSLSAADAEDFLEVYKGVVPEHRRLVDQLSSAACWAIEVRAENAVPALRAVCGPHDPEVCHILFPHTIRSKFGEDRCCNGVHCTDLPEDGPLESEFFFQLMASKPVAA